MTTPNETVFGKHNRDQLKEVLAALSQLMIEYRDQAYNIYSGLVIAITDTTSCTDPDAIKAAVAIMNRIFNYDITKSHQFKLSTSQYNIKIPDSVSISDRLIQISNFLSSGKRYRYLHHPGYFIYRDDLSNNEQLSFEHVRYSQSSIKSIMTCGISDIKLEEWVLVEDDVDLQTDTNRKFTFVPYTDPV